jgi:hypothetical protein
MRALSPALCVAACLMLLASPEAEACGDKFVRVGRGGRFQRGYVAVHPASVLVYVNKASAGAAAMRKLPSALKAAGHKTTAVETPAAFSEALQVGKYDVVLVENADLASLEAGLAKAVPRPEVMPVLHKPTPAEAAAVAKEHGCVVEDAENKYDVLVDIDNLLEQRAK